MMHFALFQLVLEVRFLELMWSACYNENGDKDGQEGEEQAEIEREYVGLHVEIVHNLIVVC